MYMRIKDLSKAVDIPTETIRYYERTGLLPPAKRTENNYRVYDKNDESRLRFIKNCRALDMNLEEVRELIVFIAHAQEDPEHKDDCSGVRVIVDEHLGHVRERLRSLKQLEKQLERLLKACDHPEPAASCGMVRELFSEMEMLECGPIQGVHTT